MSAEKNSTVHQGQSSVAGLAGRERDELGRIPQIWTTEKSLAKSREFSSRKEFRERCPSAYAYLVRRKKLHLLRFDKETKRHRVDFFDVVCDIKKCKTRSELHRKYSSSYYACHNHDVLLKIYNDHFGRGKTSKWWTKDKAIASARQFDQISEFSKQEPGAYDFILRQNLESDAFSHMMRKKSDYDTVYFWVSDRLVEGERLAKVGVTSRRLGLERIKSVSKKSGIKVKKLYVFYTNKAMEVETDIKRRFKRADIHKFNGHTEFLSISDSDIQQITGEIEWTVKALNHG